MNKVHIWSDKPNDWRLPTSWHANDHAEEKGGIVINVNSIAELQALFKDWVKWEETFDAIDFHTHGSPGSIRIGADRLTVSNLNLLYASNVDRIFNDNAQIIFLGCNVGEGYMGEFFLLQFGKMMLRGGGGKVMGSTGLGFPNLVTGGAYHPFGDWVSVHVGKGGYAKLSGHRYLVLDNIKARIKSAEERIPRLESDGSLSPSEALVVKNWLYIAMTYAANPTNRNMFHACDHLTFVEKELDEKERTRIFKGIPENAIK